MYHRTKSHEPATERRQRPLLEKAVVCLLFAFEPAGTPWAKAPISFDGFTASNGTISASCPTTTLAGAPILGCKETTRDNGMLQREIRVGGATTEAGTYIQFILTDIGVSGDAAAHPFTAARGSLGFVNEDIVKMNNRGAGIASHQTIVESRFLNSTTEDRFILEQSYLFGWARSGLDPWISTTEAVSRLDYSAGPASPVVLFENSTGITSNNSLFATDLKVELAQYVDLGDTVGTGRQAFRFERASGQFQTTTHASSTDPWLLPGGSQGGTIDWSQGQDISALWLGQSLDSAPKGAFDLLRYTNLTVPQTTRLTTLGLQSSTSPSQWLQQPFGQAPVLAAQVVTATATVAPPAPLAATLPSPASSTLTTAAAPVSLPIAYNQWSVSNGVFTVAPCPGTASCSPPIVNEGGVFQRYVTIGGVRYIQTIVTDSAATGNAAAAEFTTGSLAFKSETFVKAGPASGSGIASNLQIAESNLAYKGIAPTLDPVLPSTGGQFGYSTQIKSGWAHAAGSTDPLVVVDQRLTIPDNNFLHTTSMDSRFHMELGETTNDARIVTSAVVGTTSTADGSPSSITIDPANPAVVNACTNLGGTVIGNQCVFPGAAGTGFNNPIMFNSSYVSGALQNTSRAKDPFSPLLGNGSDIAWSKGDAIQATWVGGRYATTDPFGPSVIGATAYTNLSTGERAAIASVNLPFVTGSPGDPNPSSWSTPFTPAGLIYADTYTPPVTPGP